MAADSDWSCFFQNEHRFDGIQMVFGIQFWGIQFLGFNSVNGFWNLLDGIQFWGVAAKLIGMINRY